MCDWQFGVPAVGWSYAEKAKHAQDAGAKAVIVVNGEGMQPHRIMIPLVDGADGIHNLVTIPVYFMSFDAGMQLGAEVQSAAGADSAAAATYAKVKEEAEAKTHEALQELSDEIGSIVAEEVKAEAATSLQSLSEEFQRICVGEAGTSAAAADAAAGVVAGAGAGAGAGTDIPSTTELHDGMHAVDGLDHRRRTAAPAPAQPRAVRIDLERIPCYMCGGVFDTAQVSVISNLCSGTAAIMNTAVEAGMLKPCHAGLLKGIIRQRNKVCNALFNVVTSCTTKEHDAMIAQGILEALTCVEDRSDIRRSFASDHQGPSYKVKTLHQ